MNPSFQEFFGSVGSFVHLRAGGMADGYVQKLDQLLIVAGNPDDLKGVEVLGKQAIYAVAVPIILGFILMYLNLMSGPIAVLAILGLMILGFFAPYLDIREKAKKRQKAITLTLPDMLDLLTISVEAGLDFMSAMRRVVEKGKEGPLKDELERFFKQTELGQQRRVALRELANRVQLQDVGAVVSALIQADRLGVSVGPVLRTQSDMLRVRRAQRCEKAAGEAPVKMLAPLIMCILPSVFIMVLGPVIIQMLMNMHVF